MKNVVITGTSRGIGFELAKQFAENGHKVLALSRNTKPLQNFNHKNIKVISVDLSINSDLNKVSDFIKSNWKHVDILINNAGKLINKPFTDLSSDDFLEVYKVNVFAVAELTKLMIPFMEKGSHVITVSSMGGIQGSMKFPGLAAYSSAKGAIITGFENVIKSVPFHAGTAETKEGVVTNGGRVLAVTSFGKDIESALQNSYESIEELSFQGMNFRKDIGFDLIKKPQTVKKK